MDRRTVQEDIVAPAPEVSETPYAYRFAELMTMAETTTTNDKDSGPRVQKQQGSPDHNSFERVKGKRKRQTDPDAPLADLLSPAGVG